MEDYEKKYNSAMEAMRQWIAPCHTQEQLNVLKTSVFPELKENDDERIRKAILWCIRTVEHELGCEDVEGLAVAKLKSWLEKQGKNNIGISEATKQKLEDNLNKALEKETPESWNKFLDEQGEQQHFNDNFPSFDEAQGTIVVEGQDEQKHADNVEPKFKVGDKVVNDGKVCTIKIVNEDNYIVNNGERDIQVHFSYTKDWKLVEQKPAWSEEDEKMFNSALWHIKNSCGNGGKNSGEFEVYNWLKSFKERYIWKPSEEQMEALRIARDRNDKIGFYLSQLYDDLKKLM